MKLPGFDVDQKRIIDSHGRAFARPKSRSRMLCIGGGYIGLELGTFYAKVGTEVTVVEAMPESPRSGRSGSHQGRVSNARKAGREASCSRRQVKGCKATARRASKSRSADGTKEQTETFDVALVTIGRMPNSDGLGLEKAGVKPDAKGFSRSMLSAARTSRTSTRSAISRASRFSRTRAPKKALSPPK